jgi:N12 class adenine-specific DNA methylase
MLTFLSRFFYEFMTLEDKNITMGHYEKRRLLRSLRRLHYSKNLKDSFLNPYKIFGKVAGVKEIELEDKTKKIVEIFYDCIIFPTIDYPEPKKS